MSPFIQLLVKTVRMVRAAGLTREPTDPAQRSERDWEGLGRDLGRAVRNFRRGKPEER